ncbi:hypothetical protein ACNOYE_04595 [Nannocystaceae bacterium ST9]
MSGIIFGVFENRTAAQSAIEAVEREVGTELAAVVHEEYLRDDDVQMSGTDALKGALMGAGVVGLFGALIGGLILIPSADVSIGWTEFAFLGLAGSIMGVTAGAVAGASESREEIRKMATRLEQGKVLVTLNQNDDVPSATILELFTANGAVEVKAA